MEVTSKNVLSVNHFCLYLHVGLQLMAPPPPVIGL